MMGIIKRVGVGIVVIATLIAVPALAAQKKARFKTKRPVGATAVADTGGSMERRLCWLERRRGLRSRLCGSRLVQQHG